MYEPGSGRGWAAVSEDEEDWFERALRGEDGGTDADRGEGGSAGDREATPEPGSGSGGTDSDGAGQAGAGPTPGEATAGKGGAAASAEPTASAGPDADDGALFDDDFASAFSAAEGPDAAGGQELDLGGDDFEEESFESDIPRVDIGVEGLDSMVQGGVPERSLMVAVGSAGTGKTTFGLQFLYHALRAGDRAVYITLEESREAVLSTADERGWDFSGYAEQGQLAVVDLDPVEMANSLTSIRSELPALVAEFGASRLVLDSVSLLEMMYDDQATRRTEIYDFTRSLEEAGVTTLLTSEASEDSAYASRFGIIEYLTDAVFVLQYIRSEDHRETRLAIEIVKIRDANHSRETKPYELTGDGIEVYRQANIF
jgi:KaiC domain protein